MDKRFQLLFWDGGNFGDELNIWLWKQLMPDVIDVEKPYKKGSDRPLFVGIGTILGDNLPENQPKVVFGSGVGYHGLPVRNKNMRIYCVRGPLTAKAVNLDPKYAITDPAILIRTLKLKPIEKKYNYSFMPHHTSVNSVVWKSLCEKLGIKYIDPKLDFEEALDELRASKVVIAEAMHAAIVADALRIPWVPVNFHGTYINAFKWDDWCQSLGLKYKPYLLGLFKNSRLIKRKMPPVMYSLVRWAVNTPLASRALSHVLSNATPILADLSIVDSKTDLLITVMHDLIKDFNEGTTFEIP
jgi:succinoglycan biosynthesis protein ExoV